MTADVGPLAGCRSFVVAIDPADAVTVWITEVWESKSAWEVSLTLSGVEESIRVAIPLVADWGCTTQTEVVSIAGSGSPPP